MQQNHRKLKAFKTVIILNYFGGVRKIPSREFSAEMVNDRYHIYERYREKVEVKSVGGSLHSMMIPGREHYRLLQVKTIAELVLDANYDPSTPFAIAADLCLGAIRDYREAVCGYLAKHDGEKGFVSGSIRKHNHLVDAMEMGIKAAVQYTHAKTSDIEGGDIASLVSDEFERLTGKRGFADNLPIEKLRKCVWPVIHASSKWSLSSADSEGFGLEFRRARMDEAAFAHFAKPRVLRERALANSEACSALSLVVANLPDLAFSVAATTSDVSWQPIGTIPMQYAWDHGESAAMALAEKYSNIREDLLSLLNKRGEVLGSRTGMAADLLEEGLF